MDNTDEQVQPVIVKGESKVYVANLAWSVEAQDLQNHFSDTAGVVDVQIMTRRDGKSKGCGIVVFESQEFAERAIQDLTDTELKGRFIRLREFREEGPPRVEQKTAYGSRGGREDREAVAQAVAQPVAPSAAVHVGNLPWSFTSEELVSLCAEFGEITTADIIYGRDGRSRGYGLVVFSTVNEAQACIEGLHGYMCNGRDLSVHVDSRPEPRQNGGARRGQRETRAGDRGPEYKVFVSNFPPAWSWQDLKDATREYGEVTFADVAKDRNGKPKSFGTVSFRELEDAHRCIQQMDGLEVDDFQLQVKEDFRNPLPQN